MPTITYDGQSLMLDGRRVWLVSGSVQYTRIPRDEWGERIHAAKLAGLNTIETCVVWSRHEPRSGQFDFAGENDLRHFIELIQQAGLYCILRLGPYVGHGLDNGGLPAWLVEGGGAAGNMRLRTNAQPFLEVCSRFITALAHQVRTLQAVVNPGRGAKKEEVPPGPIILIQNEMGWSCGFDTLAASYLGELDRYYREAGFAVPVVNANDLWQSVEGEIDGWTGSSNLLSHLRQLGTIRPTQPRLVMDLRIGRTDVWGKPLSPALTPGQTLRALAETLAAGGQYNLSPFAGGTNFGFSGGSADPAHAGFGEVPGIHDFSTTSQDAGAPLDELGRPTPTYWAVRRISTFASRFHRLFSHLEPARQSVALLPAQARTAPTKGNQRRTSSPGADTGAPGAGVSVVHTSGPQGGVVFLFGDHADDATEADKTTQPRSNTHTLLLPDGSTLPVDMTGQSAAWVLLDARVTGRSQIDYCNLSAFAMVGKVFVCFGPAGSRGVLSINGSPLETLVPAQGKPAFVHEHEGLVVVVCNSEGVDQVFATDTHVYVGVAGLDRHNRPIALPDSRSCEVVDAEGRVVTQKFSPGAHGPQPKKPAPRLTMSEWACARAGEHWLGSSARFASIEHPADLVSLGAPYGYGWYRLRFNSSSAHKVRLAFPQSAHRLHLALDGEDCGVVGLGPGALPHAELPLKKKQHTLTILAENFGRVSAGVDLGEKVGLWGAPWVVAPMRLSKPKLVAAEPVALLKFKAPLWRVHEDDVSDPARLTWALQHRKRTPLIVRIDDFSASDRPAASGGVGPGGGGSGVLLLNDKPIRYFQAGGCAPILLNADQLQRGNNTLQVAMVGSTAAVADALARALHVDECLEPLTEKGEWAFAKWEPPSPDAFSKPRPAAGQGDWPAWWRATFTPGENGVPLYLDASGLSKGQIYVNGRHLGRYFVATGAGKGVGPQKRYWIPRSFVNADEPNEILVFDEHGLAPSKARVVADSAGSSLT